MLNRIKFEMNILFDIVQIQNTALKTSYLSFFILGNCMIISCSYKLQQLFVSMVSIQNATFLLHFIFSTAFHLY